MTTFRFSRRKVAFRLAVLPFLLPVLCLIDGFRLAFDRFVDNIRDVPSAVSYVREGVDPIVRGWAFRAATFLDEQVMVRLAAIVCLLLIPALVVWSIVQTVWEEEIFQGLGDAFRQLFRALIFAEEPRW
jgi:hypothetical protein